MSLTFFPRYNISTEENVADIMNEVDIDRRFKKLQCDGTHIVNIFNDHEILNTVVNNVLNIPFASESFPQ